MTEVFEVQLISKFYRKTGSWVAARLAKTPITPNQVIYFEIFLGVLAALFILKGSYFWIVLGGILFQLALFLDYVDGPLARLRQADVEMGKWMDNNSGSFIDFIVLVAVIFGEFTRYGEAYILQFGVLAVGTKFLIRTLYLQSSELTFLDDQREHHNKINKLKSLAANPLLAEFAYSRFSPAGTLLTLFALFDTLWLYVVIMGIYGTFYYLAVFVWLYYIVLSHYKE